MLTSIEIQKVFDFMRKKRVRFIDVQLELVDHLASSIEELQNENSTLDFNQALSKVYSQFPITGFNDLIQAKTNTLIIFWWKNLKTYLVGFLKWPKVLWFILFFMGFYVLSSTMNSKIIFGIGITLTLIYIVVESINSKMYSNMKASNFLSLCAYYSMCFVVINVFFSFFISAQFGRAVVLTGSGQLIICALMSIYIIALHGLLVVFPKQIRSDIAHRYKDYLHEVI